MRGFEQRQIARELGHVDSKYYQKIEAGERFPGPKIVFTLLALFGVMLHQAYPDLASEAWMQVGAESKELYN